MIKTAKIIYGIDFVGKLEIPNGNYPLNPAEIDNTIRRWLEQVAPNAPFPWSNGMYICDDNNVRYFVERNDTLVVVRKVTAPYQFISTEFTNTD